MLTPSLGVRTISCPYQEVDRAGDRDLTFVTLHGDVACQVVAALVQPLCEGAEGQEGLLSAFPGERVAVGVSICPFQLELTGFLHNDMVEAVGIKISLIVFPAARREHARL